jgi:hypothetical protein
VDVPNSDRGENRFLETCRGVGVIEGVAGVADTLSEAAAGIGDNS